MGGTGGAGFNVSNTTIINQGTIRGGTGGTGGTGGLGGTGGRGGAGGTGGAGGAGGGTGGTGGQGGQGGQGGLGGTGGTGGNGGVGITGSNLTIITSGTISGGGAGSGGSAGASGNAGSGGNAGNAGNIDGTGGTGGAGGTGGTGGPGGTGGAGGAGGSGGTGNAIAFTGGTNLLELQQGSTITGNVVAFSAADTLRLGGSGSATFDLSQIGGAAQYRNFGIFEKGGTGTWTLTGTAADPTNWAINGGTLVLNGTIGGDATVAAGATIMGSGTVGGHLTVGGTIAPGNSIGTLNVVGAYTQNAGSTYTVEVNSAGQSDRINVTGVATINGGTVAVQAAAGTYGRNTNYIILSAAGGVNGVYAGVTSNFAFLTPSLSYDANNVTLTLLSSATSFYDGARTPNQAAVGTVLDLASTSATGDFANVLEALYGLDTTQGPKVLDTLGGQNYAGLGTVTSQGAQLFMNSFQTQAGGGQTAGTAGLAGGSTYMALRADGADSCNTACQSEPMWGVWGGGMGAFGTVAGNSNANGLTYNLGGFIAGLDRRFASNFRAGVAAGFNAASLYSVGQPGTGTSNTVQVALYGEYLVDAFYLDALAGYGHSDNRMTRPLVIPGLPYRAAQGHTTANTFFGQLEAGYKLLVAPRFGGFVTPYARLQASTSTQNGFTETGADSLNLTVAAQTTQSLRTVLGAQLGAGIDAPWREKLNMVLRLGWSHEFADQTRPVNASFAGAPTLGFTTYGAQAPRDGVVLGLGGNTNIAERTSVYLRYDGDLAGGNTNHVLSGGVRYVW